MAIPRVELIVSGADKIRVDYELDSFTMRQLYPHIAEKLSRYPVEHSFVVYASMANVPLCFMEIGMGSMYNTPMEARTIIQGALTCNAGKIYVFHNHPDGYLKLSEQDIRVTDCLIKTCRIFNMFLMDHVIVGNDKDAHHQKSYYSMRDKKWRSIYPRNLQELHYEGCVEKEKHLSFSPTDEQVEKYTLGAFAQNPGTYPVTVYDDIQEYLKTGTSSVGA